MQIKRYIAKKRWEKEKKLKEERLAKSSVFDFVPDKDDLERRIVQVHLKAKETSYLDALRNPNKN